MLVILLGLAFFVSLLPVELTLQFTRKENQDYITLEIKTLFINQIMEISYLDFKQYWGKQIQLTANIRRNLAQKVTLKTNLSKEELEKMINWLQEFNKLFDVLQLISLFTDNCVYLYCQTSFGFKNPAYTGVVSGSLWAGKGILTGILNNLFDFKYHPLIEVEPKFNRIKSMEIQAESIFEFRLGNIIGTGIKLLLRGLKRRLRYAWTSN